MLKRAIKLGAFGLALLLFTISLAIARPAYAGKIIVFEDINAYRGALEVLPDRPEQSRSTSPAMSVKLLEVIPSTTITLSADPKGSKEDGYTIIKVKKQSPFPLVINTFGDSFENEYIKVDYYRMPVDGGETSHIKIQEVSDS